ncbi:MAG: hypothetical protein A3H28_06690 [Acidobacteria bacterium RIFCSPLOWO2_02_FULL_61_28]|nr:MAG: hypothetical protein A3H28_06690 [Acidobacteria bacterium RIFCSPLOWO2_02_FULL_61_28]
MATQRGWLVLPGFLAILLTAALPAEGQNTAALERQLTRRVDEYYKLFVSGEWRKVQDYITEDSYDIWLAQPKNTIQSYEIKEVKVAPDRKQADVTVAATFLIPQFPAPLTQPQRSQWVYQKRQWFVRLPTPRDINDIFKEVFGTKGPASQPQPVLSPLRFDQNPIRLPGREGAGEITVQVPFQNETTTVVTVKDLSTNCPCLKAEVDKTEVQPGEKGILTVTYRTPASDSPSRRLVVQATLSPTMFLLDLPVEFSNE